MVVELKRIIDGEPFPEIQNGIVTVQNRSSLNNTRSIFEWKVPVINGKRGNPYFGTNADSRIITLIKMAKQYPEENAEFLRKYKGYGDTDQ